MYNSKSKSNFLKGEISDNVIINVICLTILLYLFRTTVPNLKYPFLLLYILVLTQSIIFRRKQLLSSLISFFKSFYIPISLSLILIFSFFLSSKMYLTIFVDLINSIVLLSLLFLMILYVKSKDDLNLFLGNMIRYIIFFAFLISFSLFSYSIGVIPGDTEASSDKSTWHSLFGYLSSDYNFAILPVLLGMLSVFYLLVEPEKTFKKGLLNFALTFFFVTIFLAGSRRGLVILSSIIFFILLIQLLLIFKANFSLKLKMIARNSRSFLISILVLIFLMFGFVFILPFQVKMDTLNIFGISTKSYKYLTSVLLKRYAGIFSEHDYEYYLTSVWPEKHEVLDPKILWDSRVGKRVFPLTGRNVNILPENSVGYKMDKSSKAYAWDDNAYSFINISNLFTGDTITADNEYFFASVYCYISEDFNGSRAKISADGDVTGKIFQEYDLRMKGYWQKLSICFKGKGRSSPVYLDWSKSGVNNFKTLTGFIIFSKPEYGLITTNSNDPETGWGSRIYSPSYPLEGTNIEIVPKEAIGYKMDSTSNASTWDNNAYSYSSMSSLFKGESRILKNTSYYASVYCFVSEDFDGSWAMISVEGDVIGDDLTIEYDLLRKGMWQQLQVEFKVKSGFPNVNLYWSKYGGTDFSHMKGYVIYAYPEYGLNKDRKRNSGSLNNFTIHNYACSINLAIAEEKINIPSITDTDSIPVITGSQICSLSLSSESSPISGISVISKNGISNQYRLGMMSCLIPLGMQIDTTVINKDTVRKWSSKLLSEDTVYHGYKKNLQINRISNSFFGDRFHRWEFALEIFSKEYNWKQKLFGDGFDFLNWYAYFFLNDKKLIDYPHNPLLSVLLYSGIIGLFIYLYLIFLAFYYYIKYLKDFILFYIFFLIVFFFSFFSGGSPFDPPIMGFLMILPFFIHHIHKSESKGKLIYKK